MTIFIRLASFANSKNQDGIIITILVIQTSKILTWKNFKDAIIKQQCKDLHTYLRSWLPKEEQGPLIDQGGQMQNLRHNSRVHI